MGQTKGYEGFDLDLSVDERVGPGVVFLVSKPGFNCCCLLSGNQLYILLSPYLCFISFLYLDMYVLGDEAWIS